MKKCFVIICVVLVFLCASCDLLGGSLKDYIDEYTQNAAIAIHSFSAPYPRAADDTVCIDSQGSILLYLRNPKNYDVYFEYAFNDEGIQAYYDEFSADGETIQFSSIDVDHTSYQMTFPAEFITQLDECYLVNSAGPAKDISGTLTIYDSETQRPFPETYTLTLRADTKPQQAGYALLQLDNEYDEPGAKYVFCFMLETTLLNQTSRLSRLITTSGM